MFYKPKAPPPFLDEEVKDNDEDKEKKECKKCRSKHTGPSPLCPGGPY